MPGHDRSVAECVVVLALMSMDFGWCARCPTFAIPNFLVALAMQLKLVASSRGEGVGFVNQLSMLFWLAGNIIWGSAELLWDDARPAGWLADVPWLQGSMQYYNPAMGVACLLMLPTMVLLLGFYMVRLARIRSCEEPHVCLPCLPLPVYEEIFIVPWIVMDSLWGLMDLLQLLRPDVKVHPLFAVSIAAGVLAIALQVDNLRRQACLRAWRGAAMCLAELAWVGGNLMWLVFDYKDVVIEALFLFPAAAVLAVASVTPCQCYRHRRRRASESLLASCAAAAGPEVERDQQPTATSRARRWSGDRRSSGDQQAPADAPGGHLLVEVQRVALDPGAADGLDAGGRSEPLVRPPS